MTTLTYDNIDPTVLYDIFYETGTRLGGTYVALMRQARSQGEPQQAQQWQQKHIALNRKRLSINPNNREQQIQQIHTWDREIQRLETLLA